jgi:lipoprotein-anchoring transpeptidase ErfK/SrfK
MVLVLVAAMGMVAAGGVGCALRGSGPHSAVAAAAAERPEPYVLLRLGERRVYWVDEAVAGPPEAFRVAVGRARYPTPTGSFQINEMVVNPDFLRFDFSNPSRVFGYIPPGPTNPLGLRWIGFGQAHGWAVGFHGTQNTSVLGQAVSHGCVRMRNSDVTRLFDRVKLGMTVLVEP